MTANPTEAQHSAPLLQATDIGRLHLGPINLELHAGECLSIRGESGTGKSMLLRMLADLDPHEGRTFLQGQEATTMSATHWRRQVALLPAESQWWLERTGDHFSDEKALPLEALGLKPALLDKPPFQCSTGERQRLALLRMLELQPRVLLLDEPTASLDATSIKRVEALIAQVLAMGSAAIWVGHDEEQLRRVARQHYCLQEGRLQEDCAWN